MLKIVKIIKIVLIASLLFNLSFAETKPKKEENLNIYEKECIPCHKYFPASLERMFMTYLKVYSGELTLKASLKAFLKRPDIELSVMSDMFLENFSVKEKSKLSNKELDEAINIYWDLYNVRNKLK